MLGMQNFDDPALSVGACPLRGVAVVYRALAMPRSRPFGRPSHTPARFACHTYQARDHLPSIQADTQTDLDPKLNGFHPFESSSLKKARQAFIKAVASFKALWCLVVGSRR